ncbi:MAG: glycosyltransferase [Myxococcota bacterium]
MSDRLDSVYITYWSLRDPLCQSQSLPYLTALTHLGYRVGLITFEQPQFALPAKELEAERARLAQLGIVWHPLRYHKKPPVFSTLFDVVRGSVAAGRLARRSKASVVHGRASVAAAIAAMASRLASTKLFVDADGPLSQEYVDAGVWGEGSLGHRLTSWGERKSMELADVAAVLTRHREREVAPLIVDTPTYVLPCAVDMKRFKPTRERRDALRNELGLRGTCFVYAGKAGGWYDTDEMMAFLEAARREFPEMTVLVLTRDDPTVFAEPAARFGIETIVRSAAPTEMPAYLSAADVGLCFLRPFPSKLACSPIKLGEYLACGLPVVSTSGCGDYDALVRDESVGVVVENSRRDTYGTAAADLARILEGPGLSERCRDAAGRRVGLDEVVAPRYGEIYRRLAGTPSLP